MTKIPDKITKAAALLAIAPAFLEGDPAKRRSEAAATLAVFGVDPTPATVKAVFEAVDEVHRAQRSASLEPLLARVKAVTGWSDGQLAKTLDMTRASVQAYASGRSPERLTEGQKNILLAGLKRRHARIGALLQEMGE